MSVDNYTTMYYITPEKLVRAGSWYYGKTDEPVLERPEDALETWVRHETQSSVHSPAEVDWLQEWKREDVRPDELYNARRKMDIEKNGLPFCAHGRVLDAPARRGMIQWKDGEERCPYCRIEALEAQLRWLEEKVSILWPGRPLGSPPERRGCPEGSVKMVMGVGPVIQSQKEQS